MMPQGEELEVLEVLDGWVKINVDSDEGYVSSDYVEISTELLKAMTMTEIRYGQGVSDVRVSLVQYATQFVGNPYVWGGTSLTRGADCSGFVMSVFANYGISLPHSSGAQSNCGTKPHQPRGNLHRQRTGGTCKFTEVRHQDFRCLLPYAGQSCACDQ